jgi:hypothetical protein
MAFEMVREQKMWEMLPRIWNKQIFNAENLRFKVIENLIGKLQLRFSESESLQKVKFSAS